MPMLFWRKPHILGLILRINLSLVFSIKSICFFGLLVIKIVDN